MATIGATGLQGVQGIQGQAGAQGAPGDGRVRARPNDGGGAVGGGD